MLLLFVFFAAAPAAAPDRFPAPSELPRHADLAPLLVKPNGERIASAEEWLAQRDRLKAMLAYYQYGRMPPKPAAFEILDIVREDQGAAIHESFALKLTRNGRTASVRVGIFRPKGRERLPVIVKNDRYTFDLAEIADPRKRKQYIDEGRGDIDRWVNRQALARGYAIVKFNREDVAPDRPDNRGEGVFPLYPAYDWGTIAAWAWFYQPLIDHLSAQEWADPARIAVTGHSRGGKTALCAGIYDERIAVTAPSASGSGGAGSWRFFTPGGRHQDVEGMTKQHPHWFTERIRKFIGYDDRLPIGSHTAKALIAPRGLINTQGADDPLANPVGTRRTFDAAQEVFELLRIPENQAIHWRPGGHGQTKVDWLALFDFCDRVFFGKEPERRFNNWPE